MKKKTNSGVNESSFKKRNFDALLLHQRAHHKAKVNGNNAMLSTILGTLNLTNSNH